MRERGREGDRERGGDTQMACVGAGELVMRLTCWHHLYSAQQLYMVSLPNCQQVAHTRYLSLIKTYRLQKVQVNGSLHIHTHTLTGDKQTYSAAIRLILAAIINDTN